MYDTLVKDTGGQMQSQTVLGDEFEEILENLKDSPSFLKKIMAATVEVDYDTIDDLNVTEVAVRSAKLRSGDFSYSTMPEPFFTQMRIEEEAKKLEAEASESLAVTETMTKLAAGNYTKLAKYGLEYEYYTTPEELDEDTAMAKLAKIAEGEEWMEGIFQSVNQSSLDRTIELFYPRCTRKEDEVPTNAQVQMLASSVLPKTKFAATGKPEPVLGGFVIRGNHKYENGDELIAAIDKELEKSNLGDKMTVLYTDDFTRFSRADDEDFDLDFLDPDANPPVLYVLGPDICRESKPVQLAIVSALGLATSWYLAIYPFLLNQGLSARIEEQLDLAESGMPFDVNFLTDLSLPLFFTFIGLQLSHEIAHRTIAGINNIKTSPPTFVPSLITGVTSTVTTFRTPPKNKEVMFDYAVAGPLVGLLASLAAVVVGTQLTLSSDPATLPCLPLDILRQSTLGGGVIESILGGGVLYVPSGALGTPAYAGITIPLHPVAIAGYISLLVNALSLLPIGTTDGGRMATALFGRPAKVVVGSTFLLATALVGFTGSDLFLFYFSFLIGFQTGNELPSRNEVDEIAFSRVLVATTAWSLAFLTLVPFQ
jgi:membrane-associated protease RseP (regulator of RpoE activity)